MWGLTGPKSFGKASWLEIQVRVDVAGLSLKAADQQAGNSVRVSMLQS